MIYPAARYEDVRSLIWNVCVAVLLNSEYRILDTERFRAYPMHAATSLWKASRGYLSRD
jgi:hypothetical protein